MYIYQYRITYWENEEDTDNQEKGLVLASSYHEAVEKLEKFYDENSILSIDYLEADEECYNEVLTEDTLNAIGFAVNK